MDSDTRMSVLLIGPRCSS